MIINAEVQRGASESNANLLRRFTKKVRGGGFLEHIKAIRYKERSQSKTTRKKLALRRLEWKAKIEELEKLGKIQTRDKNKI